MRSTTLLPQKYGKIKIIQHRKLLCKSLWFGWSGQPSNINLSALSF